MAYNQKTTQPLIKAQKCVACIVELCVVLQSKGKTFQSLRDNYKYNAHVFFFLDALVN